MVICPWLREFLEIESIRQDCSEMDPENWFGFHDKVSFFLTYWCIISDNDPPKRNSIVSIQLRIRSKISDFVSAMTIWELEP